MENNAELQEAKHRQDREYSVLSEGRFLVGCNDWMGFLSLMMLALSDQREKRRERN